MYPAAIDCGVSPEMFWEYSYGELIDIIESKARDVKQSRKKDVLNIFLLAERIGLHVAQVLDTKGRVTVPDVFEMFPDLFDEEIKQKQEAERQKKQQELFKARFIDFAARHNARRAAMIEQKEVGADERNHSGGAAGSPVSPDQELQGRDQASPDTD